MYVQGVRFAFEAKSQICPLNWHRKTYSLKKKKCVNVYGYLIKKVFV